MRVMRTTMQRKRLGERDAGIKPRDDETVVGRYTCACA